MQQIASGFGGDKSDSEPLATVRTPPKLKEINYSIKINLLRLSNPRPRPVAIRLSTPRSMWRAGAIPCIRAGSRVRGVRSCRVQYLRQPKNRVVLHSRARQRPKPCLRLLKRKLPWSAGSLSRERHTKSPGWTRYIDFQGSARAIPDRSPLLEAGAAPDILDAAFKAVNETDKILSTLSYQSCNQRYVFLMSCQRVLPNAPPTLPPTSPSSLLAVMLLNCFVI